MTEVKTNGKCVYCNGDIVERVVKTFDPMSGLPIIGPGSARQFKETPTGFYCKNCGLKYQFVSQKS